MSEANLKEREHAIVLAGFGGQGILLAGRLLAGAAMRAGLNVLVNNYYEGFVRGGVSECTVVIGPSEIGSPIRDRPEIIAVLDARAANNWRARVAQGGLLIRNTSLIPDEAERADINLFDIPATELAKDIGNTMCASLIIVGALAKRVGIFSVEDCLAVLPEIVPPHRAALMAVNRSALERGAEFAEPGMAAAIGRRAVEGSRGVADGAR